MLRIAFALCLLAVPPALAGCGDSSGSASAGAKSAAAPPPLGSSPAGAHDPLSALEDHANGVTPAPPPPPAPARPPAPSPPPIPSEMTKNGPVGLWLMVRYSSAFNSLEKTAWFFSPDGTAYEGPEAGTSPDDLAAHKGRRGKIAWTGQGMTIAWPDGTKTDSPVERDATGFAWDMGGFTPVKPFASAWEIAGRYEGEQGVYHHDPVGGYKEVTVERSIALEASGKFHKADSAMVRATGSGSADSEGKSDGTWSLSGFTITLQGNDGTAKRMIAFPFDDGTNAWLYLGGAMYKRQK